MSNVGCPRHCKLSVWQRCLIYQKSEWESVFQLAGLLFPRHPLRLPPSSPWWPHRGVSPRPPWSSPWEPCGQLHCQLCHSLSARLQLWAPSNKRIIIWCLNISELTDNSGLRPGQAEGNLSSSEQTAGSVSEQAPSDKWVKFPHSPHLFQTPHCWCWWLQLHSSHFYHKICTAESILLGTADCRGETIGTLENCLQVVNM